MLPGRPDTERKRTRARAERARRRPRRRPATLSLVAIATAGAAALGAITAFGAHPTGASVGNAWTSATAPLPAADLGGFGPPAGNQSALAGQVACPAPNQCFAVGAYLDSAGNTAADIATIAQPSPGSVSLVHLAAPEPATDPAGLGPQKSGSAHLLAELFSLSCPSSSFCVAVGTFQDSAGHDFALVETWHGGSTWTPTVAPEPASNHAELGPGTGPRQVAALWDVDCYSAGSCVAVGSYGDSAGHSWPLVDTLSEAGWSATTVDVAGQPVGVDGESSWLEDVACAPNGFCAAGGGYNDAQHSASAGVLATGWDGRWVEADAVPPTGSFTGPVAAVACPPTRGSCVALGQGSGGLLAYTETASSWSSKVIPLPPANGAGTPASWFNDDLSISCPAAGSCIATGNANDSGQWSSEATVMNDSGGDWTSALAPRPGGVDPSGYQPGATGASLRSLACPAPGSCVAVGYYQDTGGGYWGLVETLSGSTWTASTLGDPAGSGTDAEGDQDAALFGVACSSDGSCGAAGTFDNPAGYSRLFAAHELVG